MPAQSSAVRQAICLVARGIAPLPYIHPLRKRHAHAIGRGAEGYDTVASWPSLALVLYSVPRMLSQVLRGGLQDAGGIRGYGDPYGVRTRAHLQ